jgi:hypothetical protein
MGEWANRRMGSHRPRTRRRNGMWRRFYGQVSGKVFVPKGLDDSSDSTELADVLAVYCQGMQETEPVP